jgi:peptidoglycan hydrolase CwlO-like protein
MATTIPKQGLGQNGAASDPLLVSGSIWAGAKPEPDSDVAQVLEETPPAPTAPDQEIDLLKAEQATLRCTVEELEKLLEEKMRAEQVWTEKQKELEAVVEDKSEVIRELHLKMQERPAAGGSRASIILPSGAARETAITPREEELLALSEELEEDRRQLREDEETVRTQMREMEIQMSRERAELARQRNELQRLHSEIRHELELASRHAALRDRLEPLQRRHQEMLHRKGAEPSRDGAAGAAPQSGAASPQEASARNPTGLLHRLFG